MLMEEVPLLVEMASKRAKLIRRSKSRLRSLRKKSRGVEGKKKL